MHLLTCSCYVWGQLVCQNRSNSRHQIAVNNTVMLWENLQTAMLGGHELNCWCEGANIFNIGTKGDDGIRQSLRLTAIFLRKSEQEMNEQRGASRHIEWHEECECCMKQQLGVQ